MAAGTGPQGVPADDAKPTPTPRRGVSTGWIVGGVALLWLATFFVVLPMLTLAGVGEEMMCADTAGDSCPNVSGPLFAIALALVVVVSTIAAVASRRHRNDIATVWIVGAFVTLVVGGNIVWNSDHAVAVAAVVVTIAVVLQAVITVRMVGGTKEATPRGLPPPSFSRQKPWPARVFCRENLGAPGNRARNWLVQPSQSQPWNGPDGRGGP